MGRAARFPRENARPGPPPATPATIRAMRCCPQIQSLGRWVRRAAMAALWCAWLLSIFLWLVRGRLTSIGFEREHRYGTVVVNRWYGIVYPGNGIVIAGGQATFEPDRGQPIDSFDPAGAWLEPMHEDLAERRGGWEHAGFVWRMTEHQRWAGLPAWLVAALLGIIPIKRAANLLRRRHVSPTPPPV